MSSVSSIVPLPSSCPQCGASVRTRVDGLCAACLLRIAMTDSAVTPDVGLEEGRAAVQRIGRYEILHEIARGGMGIVYRARQLGAEREVALKSLLPPLGSVPGMRERFQQEIEAVAGLDHPAILPVFEVGEHDGLPFFSMKLAERGNLAERATALHGHWDKIAEIIAALANGLAHAHERGIIHRDIKPANILFDAHDKPMLADFGLAKIRASNRQLTLLISALGSPNYMAPEQVTAEFGEVGPAADIYALGAVLYELLTARAPIVGDDASATMRLVPIHIPEPARHWRADVPRGLDAIARKCLAKQPANRYKSADAVAADLERWRSGRRVSALRDWKRGAAQRALKWVAGACAATAIGFGMWMAWPVNGATDVSSTRASTLLHSTQSIAVVPFRNVGEGSDADYLASTVTDDLLQDLRQIETLNVVPFRFAEVGAPTPTARALGEQYGVDLLLDGDFAARDASVVFRARLVSTRDDRTVWQHEFTTPLNDPRVLRAEIAAALVTQLQIDLGSDVRTRFGRDALTTSAEAYTDYLKARYLIRWRRPQTLMAAERLLLDATRLDPGFARAHSALAYTYALWVGAPPASGDHWSLAVAAANRALQLDPQLGEAYAVLGNYHSIAGRYRDAERELRNAMALGPKDPATLHLYAVHLYSVGKLRAALEVERRSVALDATSPQPMMWLAMLTTMVGTREEAERLWARADELGAARPLAAAILRLELGDKARLLEWYREKGAETRISGPADWRERLFAGVTDASQRAQALAVMRENAAHMNRATAMTHFALLGELDAAFRAADGFALVDDYFYHLQLSNLWSPRLGSFRRDPRFAALMQRWGFVDYWREYGPGDACAVQGERVVCQ